MNVNVITTPSSSTEYWPELKGLSDKVKIELIALLSSSLVKKGNNETAAGQWADRFCGVWADTRSAEEIIDDIRDMRTPNYIDAAL